MLSLGEKPQRPIPYVYPAIVVRVIDGDTLVVDIDVGFKTWMRGCHVRLLGIDCPEIHGETKEAGLCAKRFVEANVGPGTRLLVQSDKMDSFGRILATVWVEGLHGGDGKTLNDTLLELGYAAPMTRAAVMSSWVKQMSVYEAACLAATD